MGNSRNEGAAWTSQAGVVARKQEKMVCYFERHSNENDAEPTAIRTFVLYWNGCFIGGLWARIVDEVHLGAVVS